MVWKGKGSLLIDVWLNDTTVLYYAITILIFSPPFGCLKYLQQTKPSKSTFTTKTYYCLGGVF